MGNRDQGYGDFLAEGRGHLSMLDRALEDVSAEAKARVRGVLLRYGIEEDNEFFMIFVAIGHLLVLVEEAPENWQSFFDDIYRELNQWSSQNRQSLESLQLHTQTSAELIQTLRLLISSMATSADRSSRMLGMLSSFDSKLSNIAGNSASAAENSKLAASRLNQTNSQLGLLTNLTNQQTWISSISAGLSFLLVLGLGRSLWQLNAQNRVIELLTLQQYEQVEKIGWLLEKANRAECRDGIKPAGDTLCK